MCALNELSGDKDFSDDENNNVCNEDLEHHPGTEKSFVFIEILCYPIIMVVISKANNTDVIKKELTDSTHFVGFGQFKKGYIFRGWIFIFLNIL